MPSPLFRHHPDNLIYLNSDVYPLEWWMTQEPEYQLPENAIGQTYNGMIRIIYSANSQWGGESWPEGDNYLFNAATYHANWQTYLESLQEPPPPPYPSIGQLRSSFLLNSGYNRVLATVAANNTHLVTNFGIAVSVNPVNLAGLELTWNLMINALPLEEVPTPEEIASWQQIADGADFNTSLATITFNANGTITCSGSLVNV